MGPPESARSWPGPERLDDRHRSRPTRNRRSRPSRLARPFPSLGGGDDWPAGTPAQRERREPRGTRTDPASRASRLNRTPHGTIRDPGRRRPGRLRPRDRGPGSRRSLRAGGARAGRVHGRPGDRGPCSTDGSRSRPIRSTSCSTTGCRSSSSARIATRRSSRRHEYGVAETGRPGCRQTTMSRHQAKRRVHGGRLIQEMEAGGIVVRAASPSGVAEEAGFALQGPRRGRRRAPSA